MKEELPGTAALRDLDGALSAEDSGCPHSRETELKVHLKLAEEEANLLSRRIVELEVENRAVCGPRWTTWSDHGGGQVGPRGPPGLLRAGRWRKGESLAELRSTPAVRGGGSEAAAAFLRRTGGSEQAAAERVGQVPPEHGSWTWTPPEDSCSVPAQPSQEELAAAKLQIGELSGKVKKLQYENRAPLQPPACVTWPPASTRGPCWRRTAEAGDSAQCVPASLAGAPGPTPLLCRARRPRPCRLREQAVLVSKATTAQGRRQRLLCRPAPSSDNECATSGRLRPCTTARAPGTPS